MFRARSSKKRWIRVCKAEARLRPRLSQLTHWQYLHTSYRPIRLAPIFYILFCKVG
jgi:hypothetical protein